MAAHRRLARNLTIPAVPANRAGTARLAGRAGKTAAAKLILLIAIAGLAGLVGFVSWSAWDSRRQAETARRQAEAAGGTVRSLPPAATKSADGGFSIVFPDGWNVTRLKDADHFVIAGTAQPEFQTGRRAMVTDADGPATDGPAVFNALIGDDLAPPQGQATDFVFGDDNGLLSGKRYVHTYDRDLGADGGQPRADGDRDYSYIFELGGSRQLRVTYRVYADDPRDNAGRIDQVVRSIRLHR